MGGGLVRKEGGSSCMRVCVKDDEGSVGGGGPSSHGMMQVLTFASSRQRPCPATMIFQWKCVL